MSTGITTNLKGGLIVDQGLTPTTEPLVIIGTALDGPLNVPKRVRTYSEFEAVFGPAIYTGGYKDPVTSTESKNDAHSTLSLDFVKALQEGAQDVLLVRCSGSYAEAPSAFTNKLDLKAKNPGRIYNEVSVVTLAGTGAASGTFYFTLNQPAIKGGDIAYTFNTTDTIEYLIDFINESPLNRTVSINRNSWPSALTSRVTALGSGTVTLSGGTNGTAAPGEDYASNKYGLADLITTGDTSTFATLIGIRPRASVVVLGCIYADDEVESGDNTTTIFADFSLFMEMLAREGTPAIGVLGTRPTRMRDQADIISYVNNSLLATSAGYYNSTAKWLKAGPILYTGNTLIENGQAIDLGRRVLVVAGPDAIYSHPQRGRYVDTPHVSVAALQSTLPLNESLTFKRLKGVVGFQNIIPAQMARKLAAGVGWDGNPNGVVGKGAYVVLAQNGQIPGEGIAILSDPTAAARNDDFESAFTVRACNSILAALRDRLISYVGRASSPSIMAAMNSDIKDVMDSFTADQVLQGGEGVGWDAKVLQTPYQQKIGKVEVSLGIWLARAIKSINLDLTVR